MAPVRVIPCLDIKEGRVVKGVRFVDLVDARDPAEAAAAYCEQGADVVVFLDIAATVENRRTRMEWVKRVADAVTVPFAVGGGISTISDMNELFEMGVDKLSVNTAAVRDPKLVSDAVKEFGSDRIVVAIDAEKTAERFEVVVSGGTRRADLDLVEWAKQVESLGASEILLTSKDADGTRDGYDVPMTRAASGAVSIPVIASGGCGMLEHMVEVVRDAGPRRCSPRRSSISVRTRSARRRIS